MPSIEIALEKCGQLWLGKVCGPRGGADIKADNLDEALRAVREGCEKFGEPMPPTPMPEPMVMPKGDIRHGRHTPPAEPEPVAIPQPQPRQPRRANAANDADAQA